MTSYHGAMTTTQADPKTDAWGELLELQQRRDELQDAIPHLRERQASLSRVIARKLADGETEGLEDLRAQRREVGDGIGDHYLAVDLLEDRIRRLQNQEATP